MANKRSPLIALCERNEVRISDHKGFKSTPPFYYDSLRHAFGFYCNTFHTNNSSYDYYANPKNDKGFFRHQTLDIDNTILTVISFERFFELFIKNLLGKVNKKLIY